MLVVTYFGSPAQAGIDPKKAAGAALMHWFPRASGDRPDEARTAVLAFAVPPRKRG